MDGPAGRWLLHGTPLTPQARATGVRPRAAAAATTCRPVLPVAPVTRTRSIGLDVCLTITIHFAAYRHEIRPALTRGA
jgi:hypothetical protein